MTAKQRFLPVLVFAKVSIRRLFRDKVAMFFTFLFPLIFLFVFGGIFGKNSNVSFNVALINQSNSDFSQQFSQQLKDDNKIIKVDKDVSSFDDAKSRMSRGQLDATIILPQDFGAVKDQGHPTGSATIYYTQNNEQAARTLQTVMDGVFKDVNNKFVAYNAPFTVATQKVSVKSLGSFDYLFAGLLGFSLIGIGILGPVNYFPELKKQGVLRRLHTTPLRVWQYFLASVLSNIVIGLVSVSLLLVAAKVFFHLNLAGNVLELGIFVVPSIAMMLGIGLALGGWAKNERQVAPLSQIVVFPMMFLSGTFWPRFLMPAGLQRVSDFLPLTPVIDGIRLIAAEGQHLTQVLPQLGMVLGWMVVIYLLAFRFFRWE